MNSSQQLANIFSHQKGLMAKFHPIERSNFPHSYAHDVCEDIDDFQAQARIRDYAWRITEEVVEAATAPSQAHYIEELIDVLHFMTELMIFVEVPSHSLPLGSPLVQFDSEPQGGDPFSIVKNLGLAINQLKNRAWKQSAKVTDVDEFYTRLHAAWFSLMHEFTMTGMSPSEIYDAYMDKASINHKRVASGT